MSMPFLLFSLLFLFFQNLNSSQKVNEVAVLADAKKSAQKCVNNVKTVQDVESNVEAFEDTLHEDEKDLVLGEILVQKAVDAFRKILVDAKMEQWLSEIDSLALPMQKIGTIQLPIASRMIPSAILDFQRSRNIPVEMEIYKPLVQRFKKRLLAHTIVDYGQRSYDSGISPFSRSDQAKLHEAIVQEQLELAELKKIEILKHELLELIKEKVDKLDEMPGSASKKLLNDVVFANVVTTGLSEQKMLQLKKFVQQEFEKSLKKKFSLMVDSRLVKFPSKDTIVEIPERHPIPNKIQILVDNFIDDEIAKLPKTVTTPVIKQMYKNLNQFLKNIAQTNSIDYLKLFDYTKILVVEKLNAKVAAGELIHIS